MIKVKYTSTVLKQGYHVQREHIGKPYFDAEIIGVPIECELYADNKAVAYNLLKKWESEYYKYDVVSIERANNIPNGSFVHETEFYGKFYGGCE